MKANMRHKIIELLLGLSWASALVLAIQVALRVWGLQ